MKKLHTLFIIPILILNLSSCNQGAGGKNNAGAYPESGKVHENTTLKGTPDYSYALYLPKGFPGDKTWPVIVMFDPHGDGLLAVTRYSGIAEKYGYILFGSNNSKNGLPVDETNRIMAAIFSEVRNYPVDTGRIYAAGFSGGSRVASRAAMFRKDVRGVIGCGGGLPSGEQPPSYSFDYFGIAGTADFNMTEMVQLDEAFNQMGLRHFIATYPGTHAWPPSGMMEDGILWHQFNAMKDGRVPKEGAMIKLFRDSVTVRLKRARSPENYLREAYLLREAISFLNGLVPIDQYRQELAATEGSARYKKQLEAYERIITKEKEEQQEMIVALFSNDLDWWKNKLRNFSQRTAKYTDPEDTLMVARLKAYLSLLCYSNATAAMKQNEHEMANRIVTIYAMADPSNPEPNYLSAVLRSWANDSTACFDELNTAISKGFSDKGRLMQQREFESYRKSPRFFDLMQNMK